MAITLKGDQKISNIPATKSKALRLNLNTDIQINHWTEMILEHLVLLLMEEIFFRMFLFQKSVFTNRIFKRPLLIL